MDYKIYSNLKYANSFIIFNDNDDLIFKVSYDKLKKKYNFCKSINKKSNLILREEESYYYDKNKFELEIKNLYLKIKLKKYLSDEQ